MKVVKIGSRQNMLQLQDETGTSWYKINESNTECLEAVKTLTVGAEVSVQHTVITGIKVIDEITLSTNPIQEEKVEPVEEKKEMKQTVGSVNNFSQPEKPQEFKCADCGAALKDGKYKTCYTCSMAARAAAAKSPDAQDSIKRQAIGHMTSRTLAGVNVHSLDTDTLNELMERIFLKYQQLVG